MLKKIVKIFIPKRCRELVVKWKISIFDSYAIKSYSQEGEDIILREIFSQQETGFYVDIGAHHPKRFSNTYYFYKKGWRGINIDPLTGTKRLFDKVRPRDINLEMGISATQKEIELYIFDDPALSTFDKDTALLMTEKTSYKIKETKNVKTDRLENILDKYTKNIQIDLMNIDIEVYESEVVKSNNWRKSRPRVLLIELKTFDWINFENIIHKFLTKQGYEIFAKTLRTAFYRDTYDIDLTP